MKYTENKIFKWEDPCTGEEQCFSIEQHFDTFEPIDNPTFNNIDYGNNELHKTTVTEAAILDKRILTMTIKEGLAVGTIIEPDKGDKRYYISKFIRRVEKGFKIQVRRVDHTDPLPQDAEFFYEGNKIFNKAKIHIDKTNE